MQAIGRQCLCLPTLRHFYDDPFGILSDRKSFWIMVLMDHYLTETMTAQDRSEQCPSFDKRDVSCGVVYQGTVLQHNFKLVKLINYVVS